MGADQPAGRTQQRRLQVEARDGIADELDLRDAARGAMPRATAAGGKSGLDRPAGACSQLGNRLGDGQLLSGNLCNHGHGIKGWVERMAEPL